MRVGRETEGAADAAVDTVLASRETGLSETGLLEKNSPAMRESLIDGAGGNMLDRSDSEESSASLRVPWAKVVQLNDTCDVVVWVGVA